MRRSVEVEPYVNYEGEPLVAVRFEKNGRRYVYEVAELAALITQLTEAMADAERQELEWVRPEPSTGGVQ